MHFKNHFRLLAVCAAGAVAVVISASATAQVTSAPPPNPNLTAPGPQAHHPQVGRQSEPPGAVAQAPSKLTLANGTIEGFVYWDASEFSHNPASSCTGLAITVSEGSSSGPFTAYTPLGTLSNNFKYIGQVKTFLAGGKVLAYDVCTYGFDHVPVGPQLQVSLAVTQPTAFSRLAVPQYGTVGPVQIINGKCNMLPRITNPTMGDLSGHWGSCQNMAYDVNFVMHTAPRAQIGLDAGSPPPPPGSSQPAARSGPLLNSSNPSHGMLLSPNSQTPAGSNSQPGKGGLLTGTKPAPGSTVALNPQPYPPGPAGRTAAGGTVALNPQPYPPGPTGKPSAPPRTVPVRAMARTLSTPQQGQKITNPKAGLQNSTIIAVLKKQSEAALAEAAQMKLSLRPSGVQTQPSTLMSSGGNGGAPATATMLRPVAGAGSIPPASGSNTSTSRYATMTPGMIPGIALQCGHDPSMRVLTVNGGPKAAVFTPDTTSNFNFYTIAGCSFGNPGPNVKAYIFYQGTFHKDFEIQQWSENFIALNLNPNITGVDDQNDVTLVIQRQDGQQTSKSGYKFYAARNSMLLPLIPQRYFSLSQFRPDQSTVQTWKPTYTSASSSSVVPNLAGLSAEVHWDITTDPNGSMVGGKDDYDFGSLHSSFVVDSAMLEWRNLSCTDSNYNVLGTSNDNWALDWYGNSGLQVSWQAQVCKPNPGGCGGGPIVQNDCFVNAPESNYGVDVWVTGPRGLDPWTGKPLS